MSYKASGFSPTEISFFNKFNEDVAKLINCTALEMKARNLNMTQAIYLVATVLLLRYVSLAMLCKLPKTVIIETANSIINDRIDELAASKLSDPDCETSAASETQKSRSYDMDFVYPKIWKA